MGIVTQSFFKQSLDCPMSRHMSQHWNTTKNIQHTTQQTTLNATNNIGYSLYNLNFGLCFPSFSVAQWQSRRAQRRAVRPPSSSSLGWAFFFSKVYFFTFFSIFLQVFSVLYVVYCLNQCLDICCVFCCMLYVVFCCYFGQSSLGMGLMYQKWQTMSELDYPNLSCQGNMTQNNTCV